MRSLQLQAALTELVTQAVAALHAEVLSGHEVPFELDSHAGRGRSSSPLYCYRPLTGRFIAEHFAQLRQLDAYARASALLEGFDGLDRYLARGLRERPAGSGGKGRCDRALLALLEETFDGQTDFELRKERLEEALERLDGATLGSGELTLVATLHGLTIVSPELALTRGLTIARPEALQGIPEQALDAGYPCRGEHLLAVLSVQTAEPRAAIAEGVLALRELLRALRLFGDGRIALGPLGWSRVDSPSTPWSPVALGLGGHPHGMLVVGPDQEDELRAFCNLVSRRAPEKGEIAWGLRRFELGCERASEYEGLSDHLLALRALLGAPPELASEDDGAPDGLFAARLAALCAPADRRAALVQRTLRAIALERQVIAGTAVERSSGLALARELSDHLRALLRDVLCGHLRSDLALFADGLLISGEEPGEQEPAEWEPEGHEPDENRRGQGRLGDAELGEQALGDEREAAEVLDVAV